MEDPFVALNSVRALDMNSHRPIPAFTRLSTKSTMSPDYYKLLHVDLAWEMAKASLSVNNNHVVLNGHVCQVIGKDGVEELKRRLR